MDVPIGELRHQITFQERTQVSDFDLTGTARSNWTDITTGAGATVWAKIRPATATEQIQADALQMNTTHKVLVRYRSDLEDTKLSLLHGTDRYNVHAVANIDQRDRWLELSTEYVG